MSSNNSFKNFREVLSSVTPPCIPYLGMYLTGLTLSPSPFIDLTFIDEGNPNTLMSPKGKDLINFHKRRLVYNVIASIQQLQQTAYNLQPVHQIAVLFRPSRMRQSRMDEKEMWNMSLQREPRGATLQSLL